MATTSAPPESTLALDTGEIVDLTIRAHVAYMDRDGSVTFRFPDNRPNANVDHYLKVDLANPHVTVRRTIPADGEPQAGDLWRDRHGTLYTAILPISAFEEQEIGLLLRPVGGRGRYGPWEVIHTDRELGPITLDYRPDPTPGQVAAAALTPDEVPA